MLLMLRFGKKRALVLSDQFRSALVIHDTKKFVDEKKLSKSSGVYN